MLELQTIPKVALAAYQAAGDASRWAALMARVRDTFSATSALLLTPPRQEGSASTIWAHCGSHDELANAQLSWAGQRAWLQALEKAYVVTASGTVLVSDADDCWAGFKDAATLGYGLVANGGPRHAVLVLDSGDNGYPLTLLSIVRSPAQPALERQELEGLRWLQADLQCALRYHWLKTAGADLWHAVTDALNAAGATIVLESDGRIAYRSTEADLLFGRPGAAVSPSTIRMEGPEQVLVSIGSMTPAAFASTLSKAADGNGSEDYTWWHEADSVRTARVRVSPLLASSGLRALWPSGVCLVTVQPIDEGKRGSTLLQAAMQLFGITTGQLRVLLGLIAGEAPADMKRTIGIAASTVNTHKRDMFEKLGVATVEDLLLTVLRGFRPKKRHAELGSRGARTRGRKIALKAKA